MGVHAMQAMRGGSRPFRDRRDAGRQLAAQLRRRLQEVGATGASGAARSDAAGRESEVLVVALPRGGVPVAHEVAAALDAPLDVFLVRKLGLPGHEELAMGAIASGGVRVLNPEVVEALRIPAHVIDSVVRKEAAELARRERAYRDDRPPPEVRGHTVVLVDDGLATGSTMRAAATALRRQGPRRLVVGVPVSAPSTCDEFRDEVDEIVCVLTPEPFYAVGVWYEDFSQTTDDEVRLLLRRAARRTAGARQAA
jgi:putative phosphoribosyl transferase